MSSKILHNPLHICFFLRTFAANFIPRTAVIHMKLSRYIAPLAFLLLSHLAPCHASTQPTDVQANYLNSVKITFLSWFSGSTKVSYERAFPKISQSGEACVSMIGAGYDKYKNQPLGFTVRYGHKFFLADNQKQSLRGFYLRPELIYSHYTYNSQADQSRTLANMGAALATVGYQYVYKRLLADVWVGGGYAFGNPADTGYHHGFELWHWFDQYNPNIAMSFSIRLGVCF